MDNDKRKKAKLTTRPIPPVNWILKHATGAQLALLNRIRSFEDFQEFVKLVDNFAYYNTLEVMHYKEKDSQDLLSYRAAKVAEIAALKVLLWTMDQAKGEIERRKKIKNR